MQSTQAHTKESEVAGKLLRFGGAQVNGVNAYPNKVVVESVAATASTGGGAD